MRIAVAASLLKAITAESTGGTEAFAHILTEGLVAAGLNVTLFATSDSKTSATLNSIVSSQQTTGIYEGSIEVRTPYQLLQAQEVIRSSESFDLIHNNYFHYYLLTAFSSFTSVPIVTSMHNHYWQNPNLKSILTKTVRKGKDMIVFSSKAAQRYVDGAFDSEVIYHGIDSSAFTFSDKPEDYFLFLGRVVPSKGIEDAIAAARRGSFRLKVAGGQAVVPEEKAIIEKNVTPYFSDTILKVGSPNEMERNVLYRDAKALIFPTRIEEQFGLVAAEAMASGTPVIAYNRGALAEVVEDGLTGFIVDPDDDERPGKGSWVIKKQGVEGIVEAMQRIDEIDRHACRKRVEEHFTRGKMIENYIALYQRLLHR